MLNICGKLLYQQLNNCTWEWKSCWTLLKLFSILKLNHQNEWRTDSSRWIFVLEIWTFVKSRNQLQKRGVVIMEENVQKRPKGFEKFLQHVEIVGNKIPYPVSLFIYLSIAVILLSVRKQIFLQSTLLLAKKLLLTICCLSTALLKCWHRLSEILPPCLHWG